jgi:hypothetical protein
MQMAGKPPQNTSSPNTVKSESTGPTPEGAWRRLCSIFRLRHLIAALVILAAAAITLDLMGRRGFCEAGDLRIWSSDIYSEHNSQHLLDPYTFTHVLHGIGFYALLWLTMGRWTSAATRGIVMVGLESLWEIIENTETVIGRYREGTIALGYYGDSIVNSMGDILACAAGYLIAFLIPAWASVAVVLAVEMILVLWIRDSLLLNIIMLIHPIEAIRTWQSTV